MKFEFNKGNEVRTDLWEKNNEKLEHDLEELVEKQVDEKEVFEYLSDLVKKLECVENGRYDNMLFLMYDAPNTMPADCRVDYVYKPTYIAATFMMTAYCRYYKLRLDRTYKETLSKVLNATLGRNFLGSGWDDKKGLLDTLCIFFKGDTIKFIEKYPKISTEFCMKLNEAITYLETEICAGKVKNAWTGKDEYSERGKQILKMI